MAAGRSGEGFVHKISAEDAKLSADSEGNRDARVVLEHHGVSAIGDSDVSPLPIVNLGDSVIIEASTNPIEGEEVVEVKESKDKRREKGLKRKRESPSVLRFSGDSDDQSSNSEEVDDPLDASSSIFEGPSTSGYCPPTVPRSPMSPSPQSRSPSPPSTPEGFDHPVPSAKGRNRPLNPEKWAVNVSKSRRNLGKSYTSKFSKKYIAGRKIGPPCTCSNKCFTKLNADARQKVFGDFWEMGDFTLQNAYIQKQVRQVPIKRKRTKAEDSRKKWTLQYVVTSRNVDHHVCKIAFISIHGITGQRVRTALAKVTESGATIKDMRGSASNPHKIGGRVLECVHENIQQLNVCYSHYTRAKSKDRQYLPSYVNISQLYEAYREWMLFHNPAVGIVKVKFFYKIFSRDYNIGFEPVKKDTCQTCLEMENEIQQSRIWGRDCTATQQQLQQHLDDKNKAFNAMRDAKSDDPNTWACISMDLQQVFPCPKMSVGMAYYKRKVTCYTFGITNLQEGQTYLYLWEEDNGGRGSSEIGSCLLRYLKDHIFSKRSPPRNLRIFADNCGGQNKNLAIVAGLLREVHLGHFDRIELNYLVKGHSYMACDRAFGLIEKVVQKVPNVWSPMHYRDCVRRACSKPKPFVTCCLTWRDFHDFSAIFDQKLAVKTTPKGKAFRQCSVIVLKKEYPAGYLLKSSYATTEDQAVKVRIAPPKTSLQLFNLAKFELPQKFKSLRLLDINKRKELKDLVEVMPRGFSSWLRDLLQQQEQLAAAGSDIAVDENPDDPSIDNIMDRQESVHQVAGWQHQRHLPE